MILKFNNSAERENVYSAFRSFDEPAKNMVFPDRL
jgi:hypothetical protein